MAFQISERQQILVFHHQRYALSSVLKDGNLAPCISVTLLLLHATKLFRNFPLAAFLFDQNRHLFPRRRNWSLPSVLFYSVLFCSVLFYLIRRDEILLVVDVYRTAPHRTAYTLVHSFFRPNKLISVRHVRLYNCFVLLLAHVIFDFSKITYFLWYCLPVRKYEIPALVLSPGYPHIW